MSEFKIDKTLTPAGDQPRAISALVKGLKENQEHQTLLGVTGSGKTFTVANIIEKMQKPTLVIAHNKTLAAQLAQEYRDFFPQSSVHYFVSYYDYYQPEAYMPITDTYIEKEAQINEEIDRLRHASTQALLTRRDTIVVASVSCIYGLGSPAEYEKVNLKLVRGMKIARGDLIRSLVAIYFERTNADMKPGTFRALGNTVEIMPVNERVIYRIEIKNDSLDVIQKIDQTTRAIIEEVQGFFLFPAKHFVTDKEQRMVAVTNIKSELAEQLKKFTQEGKILEAERLKRRTNHDLALLKEVGYCNGIENYSRHLSGRNPGEPPDTLLSYFPRNKDGSADFLTIIDESHVTIPQIGGMYEGDASRKRTLIEHGFRLPSASDNRPLTFKEFEDRIGQVIYTSATPGSFEKEKSTQVVEQIIRPTGLIDPELVVRPVVEKKGKNKGQIADFIEEAEKAIERGNRVLATTLTKKMAEDLSGYLKERGIKAEYLHSDIKTMERIQILTDFRKGEFDIIVGVNLLREGLDLPEVSLIGILDADKEGFLRSETSLIQTIGRAARNVEGKVILYADHMTGSLKKAIDETNRRREIQVAHNKKHNITPTTIIKNIRNITDQIESEHKRAVETLLEIDRALYKKSPRKLIKEKERQMSEAVKVLDFETAAILRDEIRALESKPHKK
ncbi:MAG TPA: excinuclease ABC subunit UvrB [Candidatus Paceibacterota bacterium]